MLLLLRGFHCWVMAPKAVTPKSLTDEHHPTGKGNFLLFFSRLVVDFVFSRCFGACFCFLFSQLGTVQRFGLANLNAWINLWLDLC